MFMSSCFKIDFLYHLIAHFILFLFLPLSFLSLFKNKITSVNSLLIYEDKNWTIFVLEFSVVLNDS